MASDVDASCENDPNFAVICAFFEKFGENCALGPIDFAELQSMLENTDEVPPALANLLIKLMRKVKKTVKPEKWEKALVGICHNFSSKDAWEIERFGFKKAKLSSKVRALKELLEMQFDFNAKFKGEVNKLAATELRSQPLGRDKSGHAYWFHSDHNFQIRVYKEDLDDETWTLIAKDRESLVSLITKLNDGEVKCSSDSAVNEDSNSLSEKLIIDTGQNDSDSATKDKITEDDVEQSPKKMKLENDMQEDKVLKIHLTDIKKSPKRQECDKSEETNENEKVIDENKEKEDETEDTEKEEIDEDESKDNEKEETEEDDEAAEKSPIVGDTIEEDTMHIRGEGNGKENDAGIHRPATESSESPIIGEVIEEEIMYVRGEGLGQECETGNDKKTSVTETQSGGYARSHNSSSTENSIKDDEVKKGENVSKEPSDEIDSCAKTPEKKPTFFFGSPQKETSVNTSLTMEFGQKPDQAAKSPSNTKEPSHDSLEEKNKNGEDIKNESTKVVDDNQNKNVSKNGDENPKEDDASDEDSSEKRPVVEEPCVKKLAYVCGEDTAEEDAETVTENEVEKDVKSKSNKLKNSELDVDNEVKSKEASSKDVGEIKTSGNKPDDVESETETNSKIENDKGKPKGIKNKTEIKESENESKSGDTKDKPEEAESKTKSDKSDSKNDSQKSDKDKEKSEEPSKPEKPSAKPGLRAVRMKRGPTQNKSKEETPAKDEKVADTEVVFLKSRRGKKEREATPPTKVKVKKPKLSAKEKNKKEDKVDSDNASVTSGDKAGKGGSMASASSSRVSTPVSMPDSIITIPEITEVTSVEEEPPVPEKDPLGCSEDDQDDDAETAPTPNSRSLQNFSFDFDDTGAAPVIPVIPSTRSLRKRGREASPTGPVVDKQQGGKKMKLKGKRRFNTKLRKSIEQQKQQLQQV
ncbi:unnamed protein product [Acanthoscelides obtectus]|uniref:Remodeling and spacing factor 1 n=1 Tax=Acanthoscelides obtectus TaxID=200917 RepID=A0A9P0L009_ACAOB|nr:unnamed protein product [Acanthoscelides obtectus]CAK1666424.1 hypothetical protein AOBTE_LOCUS25320 [Acanthoscelides obtectus]